VTERSACCTRDEGGPLGLGRQGLGSNHRKLLWHNGWGGERFGKRRDETRQVCAGKANESDRRQRVESEWTPSKPGSDKWPGTSPGGWPVCRPSGGRHRDGVSPAQALVRNAGTCATMTRETSKWQTHKEPSTDAWCRDGRARSSDEAG
jgi:hypothetical protein